MTDRITTILNRVAEGVWNRRETSIGTLSQCAFCCVAPHSVHKDNCPVRLAQDELTFQEVNKSLGLLDDELEVKPNYKHNEVLLCIEPFYMRSGEIAFKENEMYEIKEVIEYDGQVDYILDSIVHKNHTMPEVDLDRYFIRFLDESKKD